MNMKNSKNAFSCTLTTLELQKRKATIIQNLKSILIGKEELNNGYDYIFNGTDDVIDLLTDFVKTERQCCSFFNFSIEVLNTRLVHLKITGEAGAKEFLVTELEM